MGGFTGTGVFAIKLQVANCCIVQIQHCDQSNLFFFTLCRRSAHQVNRTEAFDKPFARKKRNAAKIVITQTTWNVTCHGDIPYPPTPAVYGLTGEVRVCAGEPSEVTKL